MSHLVNGFCVKDITALSQVVKEQCPQLELVEGTQYRTWITDHGRLAGDYPIPGFYQAILANELSLEGFDLAVIAKEMGVTLPAKLSDLESQPWNLATQKRLLQNEKVHAAYKRIVKERMSKDCQYVIRYKAGEGNKGAYEIGVIPHPFRNGEFVLMMDFFSQGNGLLNAKGLGKHESKAGVDNWANQLKQGYAARATERVIQQQMAMGNPAYGQVTRVAMPDGRLVYQVKGR